MGGGGGGGFLNSQLLISYGCYGLIFVPNQSETRVSRRTKETKLPVCNSALNFWYVAEALQQFLLTRETVNNN